MTKVEQIQKEFDTGGAYTECHDKMVIMVLEENCDMWKDVSYMYSGGGHDHVHLQRHDGYIVGYHAATADLVISARPFESIHEYVDPDTTDGFGLDDEPDEELRSKTMEDLSFLEIRKWTLKIINYKLKESMEKKEISDVAEMAMDSFWGVVSNQYPEVESGDLSPGITQHFTHICEGMVKEWLVDNRPEELEDPDSANKYKFIMEVLGEQVNKVCKDMDWESILIMDDWNLIKPVMDLCHEIDGMDGFQHELLHSVMFSKTPHEAFDNLYVFAQDLLAKRQEQKDKVPTFEQWRNMYVMMTKKQYEKIYGEEIVSCPVIYVWPDGLHIERDYGQYILNVENESFDADNLSYLAEILYNRMVNL